MDRVWIIVGVFVCFAIVFLLNDNKLLSTNSDAHLPLSNFPNQVEQTNKLHQGFLEAIALQHELLEFFHHQTFPNQENVTRTQKKSYR